MRAAAGGLRLTKPTSATVATHAPWHSLPVECAPVHRLPPPHCDTAPIIISPTSRPAGPARDSSTALFSFPYPDCPQASQQRRCLHILCLFRDPCEHPNPPEPSVSRHTRLAQSHPHIDSANLSLCLSETPEACRRFDGPSLILAWSLTPPLFPPADSAPTAMDVPFGHASQPAAHSKRTRTRSRRSCTVPAFVLSWTDVEYRVQPNAVSIDPSGIHSVKDGGGGRPGVDERTSRQSRPPATHPLGNDPALYNLVSEQIGNKCPTKNNRRPP